MSAEGTAPLFWLVVFGGWAFMSASGLLGAARGRDQRAARFWAGSFAASSFAAAYFLWRLL